MTTTQRKTRTKKVQSTDVSIPAEPTVKTAAEPVAATPDPTPIKRDWFVIRYLPENEGTPTQNKKAWDAELKLLYGMIKGQKSKPLTTEKRVGGIKVAYILGQQELIDFLTKEYPSYVEGGCPKYEFPKE